MFARERMLSGTACAVLSLVLALALVSPVEALSRSFRDARAPAGAHDIRRLAVDNAGPRVGVTVVHKGARWRGRVVLRLDTSARTGFEHIVTIRHARDPRPTFRHLNGARWACGGRVAVSRPREPYTRLSFPRRCAVGGATFLRAQVVADPAVGRTDRARTGTVMQFAPANPPAQARPNVLMFQVDDMRADDLAAMPLTRRWLGAGGTTWRNGLAPYPLCCPARASLLTGQYSHNHEVYSHKEPYGFHSFDDRSTLATWLDGAGYHTTMLGKYLNGYGGQPAPGKTTGDSRTYFPPGWDDWRASLDGAGTYNYWGTTLTQNRRRGFLSLRGEYQTYAYGRIASGMVAANAPSTTPFFSLVSFTGPHHGAPREADDPGAVVSTDGRQVSFQTPAVPPDVRNSFNRVLSRAPGLGWNDPDPSDMPEDLRRHGLPNAAERRAMLEVHRQRWEALMAVDTAVDQVMRTLQQTGELGRTYVLFTSDNGYFLGEHTIRQGKTLPYDAASKVPLLVRGPGIPAGQVRNDPFLSIDFAPTIMQMAGLADRTPSAVDGAGLLDVARRGDRGWRRTVLLNTGPESTVRTTDESGNPLVTPDPGTQDRRYLLGVRTSRYLYTDRANGFEELYDLANDPRAYDNLVRNDGDGDPATPNHAEPGHTALLDSMRARLAQVRGCNGAGCRVEVPPPPAAP